VGLAKFGALLHPLRRLLGRDPENFLKRVTGVVHVGANTGQERHLYRELGLRVVWIEANPDVFERLLANLTGFDNQIALNALITDTDYKDYEFHIANNDGASSSIFNLNHHRDIWPEVEYVESRPLKSITLATLFRLEGIDVDRYQALIMDTQGSELLVMQGALPILDAFDFVKTEVADFEAYAGCSQLEDIRDFMNEQGYREITRRRFARRAEGGSYFDIVYRRQRPRSTAEGAG
jgi:FkbM family methyltransferase